MKLTRTRVWRATIIITTLALGASLPTLDAQASTIANGNEGLALGAGQLSVGAVVNGSLSGVINSSIQGTYPQATWSDTTGSGAGWQGSIAVSSAVYTGSWTPQGSAPALASTSAGGYTGTTDGLQITISVGSSATSTSTPFTWTDNSGGSGSGTATNGTPAAVEGGITIDFASGTTYTSGAQYMVDAGAQSSSALELLSSAASVAAATGTVSPAPTLVNSTATVTSGGATTLGTSVPFVSAAQGSGMGGYTVAPGVDVIVDGSSWAATYVAQAQYTIASGPGSAGAVYSNLSSASVQQAAVTTDSYTGSAQTYTVPSGVSLVQITAYGAQGGGGAGGDGGAVVTYLSTTGGQVFTVYDGSTSGSVSGAPNGFGSAGGSAINGGGGTSVYSGSTLLIIGGGGGAGSSSSAYGAAGGAGGNPGINGNPADGGGVGYGTGATQSAGGVLSGYSQMSTVNGSFGTGGQSTDGAGGGGGYYGGGPGGEWSGYEGGGGGGSSWAASSAQDVSYITGANAGNGSVSFQPVGVLPPSNLTGSYDSSTGAVALSWTASPSSNVVGYAVFRSGTEIGTTTITSFTDTSAPTDATITYGVEALTSGLPSSEITTSVVTSVYIQTALDLHPSVMWDLAHGTGTATDLSGNGINGTYEGGTSAAAAYNNSVGGSTLFNGSTGYVGATLPTAVAGGYSITGWVNIAALPTVAGGDPLPFSDFGYYGESGFGVRSNDDLTVIYDGVSWQQTAVTISLNTWYMVTMTMTTAGAATVYVDGSEVATTSSSIDSGTLVSVAGQASAPSNTGSARWLNGTAAGFAFYNSVLTASQVSSLYTASS